MLKEFVEKLLELKRPETIKVDGREYSTIDIRPVYEPLCATIRVNNLDSLIKYLLDNPDTGISDKKIINVLNQAEVTVDSSIFGKFKQRECYICANCSDLLPDISFGRFMKLEEFIIMLKSKFIMTEDLEQIIKLVGNIQDENVTNYNDDGITQKITTKTGIARVGEAALPPKVKLVPYRTFIEVPQPQSEFLLRAKKGYDGIEFALFEADGGAWKKEAINNISSYLSYKLKDIKDIIILN